MTSIDVKVTGASIVASADGNLTSGMVGIDVRIEYDSSWDRLSKTAIFRAGRFERSRENIGTTTTVPWEVVRHHGKLLQVGIVGKDADGNIVMPTIWTSVGTILPGANEAIPGAPNPDRPDDPTGGGAAIDDGVVSPDKTWSSRKIASEISNAGAALINNTRIDDASTWSSKNIVDKLCPTFTKSGAVVTCEPVEGYPLEVTAEEGAKIFQSGGNLLKINGRELVTAGDFDAATKRKFNGNKAFVGISGNNYFNRAVITDYSLTDTGLSFMSTFVSYGIGFDLPVHPGTVYTISTAEEIQVGISFYGADGAIISFANAQNGKYATKAPAGAAWALFVVSASQANSPVSATNLQVNIGEYLTFEAYKGGIFTPSEQIPALAGINTLYADSGNITVTGKADPVAIIENQNARIAALEAALVNT